MQSSKGIEQYVKLYIIIEPNVRKLGGFGNLWVYILNCKRKAKILKLKYFHEIVKNVYRSVQDMLNVFKSCDS